MTLTQIIGFAINASIFLIVFALGLNAVWADVVHLLRRPGLLARSILAMNVVMLAVAVAVVLLFDLHPAIEIALVALALSPVPPVLPGKQKKAGGSASYTIGLLVAAASVAIVLIPAVLALAGTLFGTDARMPAGPVASAVALSVILPLAAGVIVRQAAPDFAARIARPVSLGATVLLVVAVLPLLYVAWPAIRTLVGDGVVLALVLFTLAGIAVGHVLGGPDPGDRTVLALAAGTRHPGVAIAIANLNFPEERAVLAVVILHLLLGAIASLPYVAWRKRVHAAEVAP